MKRGPPGSTSTDTLVPYTSLCRTGEVWLAHGSDHGGSLRGPASHTSVVGLRPTPGRVTRGTVNNLFSPSAVEGPMARNVPDIALFLATTAGECRHDPMRSEERRAGKECVRTCRFRGARDT